MEIRKQYTKEFKLDAISLVLDQGITTGEVVRSLGIRASMLGRWIKENQLDINGKAFRGNGKLTLEQEEIRRFKIENKQLKLERQILMEWSFCERNEVKYSFITQKKKTYPMGLFCRLLDVSRSAHLSI